MDKKWIYYELLKINDQKIPEINTSEEIFKLNAQMKSKSCNLYANENLRTRGIQQDQNCNLLIIDRTSLLTRLSQEWGLNSRGLKRICSDSCSWTFGIQGENSMKSRDEIVIIMLQWLRLYTLGSRGSREFKTFLETRLISSRVDQKFKNKEGKYMLLKRKLGPKTSAIEAVVGVVWRRRGNESLGAASWLQFHEKSALIGLQISLQKGHDFRHNRAAIGLRSGVDRGVRASSITFWSMGDKSAPESPRSRLDRAAIVEFFHAVPPPSDCALTGWTPRSWGESTAGRPMEIQRSEGLLTSPLIARNPDRPRNASHRGRITSVRWSLIPRSNRDENRALVFDLWSRGLGSTRSSPSVRRSDARRASTSPAR